MIQLKTVLNVIDNSGALLAECIRVAHGGRYGGIGLNIFYLFNFYQKFFLNFVLFKIGDPITVVIKKARPITNVPGQTSGSSSNPATKLAIRRGEVKKALIVRTRKETRRADGRYIRFDDNACILLNNKLEPLGTRILGVVGSELRGKKWGKVVSLAPRVI